MLFMLSVECIFYTILSLVCGGNLYAVPLYGINNKV